jgi:molecular chaperone DnaK (HSP70)
MTDGEAKCEIEHLSDARANAENGIPIEWSTISDTENAPEAVSCTDSEFPFDKTNLVESSFDKPNLVEYDA